MYRKLLPILIGAMVALASFQSLAVNKRADEAGGGRTGTGPGTSKGGTNSDAGRKAVEAGHSKVTKEATGVARTESKQRDQKIQRDKGR